MNCFIKKNANLKKNCEDGAEAPFQAAQKGHADVCTVLPERNRNVNEKPENTYISITIMRYHQ